MCFGYRYSKYVDLYGDFIFARHIDANLEWLLHHNYIINAKSRLSLFIVFLSSYKQV